MHHPLDQFLKEYKRLTDNRTDNYFSFIYGSVASETNTKNSDIDLMLVTELELKDEEKQKFIDQVCYLMEKYNFSIDNEVPFLNKLVVSFKDLEDARSLKWLDIIQGKISVEPIIKSLDYLQSYKMRLRLIFNVFNTNNRFLFGDITKFSENTQLFNLSLMLLAFILAGTNSVKIDNIVDSLIQRDSFEGEMFLGFKNKIHVREHLHKIIFSICNRNNSDFSIFDNLCNIRNDFYETEKLRIEKVLLR